MSLLPIDRHPGRRQLLVFGLAWLLVFAALGFRQELHHRSVLAGALALAAVSVPAAGLLHPEVLRRAYVGLSLLTFPIGWVVSWLVLTLAYYFVLTPIALVMRLFRYDPLQRAPDRRAASYWSPRTEVRPPESYFRQN